MKVTRPGAPQWARKIFFTFFLADLEYYATHHCTITNLEYIKTSNGISVKGGDIISAMMQIPIVAVFLLIKKQPLDKSSDEYKFLYAIIHKYDKHTADQMADIIKQDPAWVLTEEIGDFIDFELAYYGHG